jgi:hypothetical protein
VQWTDRFDNEDVITDMILAGVAKGSLVVNRADERLAQAISVCRRLVKMKMKLSATDSLCQLRLLREGR